MKIAQITTTLFFDPKFYLSNEYILCKGLAKLGHEVTLFTADKYVKWSKLKNREIEKKSEGLFKFNHGTLYPILHKLEKDDLIKGIWKQEGPKRKRKYYTVTTKGKKYFVAQTAEWKKFFEHFFVLLGE